MNNLNIQIFKYLNSFAGQNVFLDKTIVFFATTFSTILIILAVLFLLFHKEKFKLESPFSSIIKFKRKISEIIVVFVASGFAWILSKIIKTIITAPRPYLVFENIKTLFPYGGYDSFPSGHATFFAGLAMALYLYHKKVGIIFFIGALLIGVARIMAGVHFPVDILAGYAIGIFISYTINLNYRKVIAKTKI
ncbi:MAG: phosphatase PAP2 family protein [Candidatus Paceibacterota bacterium]|jgi:undecaprenyl-diphosphatase